MSSDKITSYDEYSRFVRHAMEHLEEQQHRVQSVLRDRDKHALNSQGNQLTLYLRKLPLLTSAVVLAGSYDYQRSLWRWGWAHSEATPELAQALEDIRAVGDARGFLQLTRDVWTARRDEAWQMVAIATLLLDGRGVYAVESGLVNSYYILLDPLSFEPGPHLHGCEW